jgi:hypothetical protein
MIHLILSAACPIGLLLNTAPENVQKQKPIIRKKKKNERKKERKKERKVHAQCFQ